MVYPFDSEIFLQTWELWKAYKKEQFRFTYKPIGEQAALMSIGEMSGNNEDIAIRMIHQSIASGWRGVFELKQAAPKGLTYQQRILQELSK